MEELIKIRTSGKTGNPIVDARDLHKGLKIGKDFSTWIKAAIDKYGFVENTEYARVFLDADGKQITFPKNGELVNTGFQTRIEYALTVDCAKQIAMVQNNEEGRKLRLYFIEVEKTWKADRALQQSNDITIPIPEVAKLYNMGINVFRGKMRYYGIFGNVKSDYKQYNRPYLKFIADGCFIGDQPTRTKGMALINEVFLTGESLRESNDVGSKENQSKIDCMYAVVRAMAGLFSYNQGSCENNPKKLSAINTLNSAMHTADELFNLNKQKSLE